jgi:hypothetical protein
MTIQPPDAPFVIKDPEAVPDGYKIVISVEAIRDRTSERWWAKQDTVWEFAQRQFKKEFPRTDAIQKLNDVEYLIVQSADDGRPAQFKAITLLKAILTYFLGTSTLSQLNVSVVRSSKDGVFETDMLSLQDLAAMEHFTPGVPMPENAEVRTHPPNQSKLSVKGDRLYEVLVPIEPIWNVYKQAVASYYLRPLTFEVSTSGPKAVDLDDIGLQDALAIDLAMLKDAAGLIRDGEAAGTTFALHIPVHFRCLRSLSCRSEFARLLPLFADIRKYLVFCIVGVPDGAPKGLLAEAISALRPHGSGVIMRAGSLNMEVQRWQGLGLSGVSYDFIDELQGSAEVIDRIKQFGAASVGTATALIGHAISNRPLLLAAWAAGFTHISGAPISEKIPETRAAIRFPATKIYA